MFDFEVSDDIQRAKREALKLYFEGKDVKFLSIPAFADDEIILVFGEGVLYFCGFKNDGELYVEKVSYKITEPILRPKGRSVPRKLGLRVPVYHPKPRMFVVNVDSVMGLEVEQTTNGVRFFGAAKG